MLKIKITWPVAFLILLAVIAWLIRQSEPKSVPARKVAPSPRTTSRPASRRARSEPQPVIIIDQVRDGHAAEGRPDPDQVSYAEAIRAPLGTYTDAEIDAIAARELREAAGEAFDQTPHTNPLLTRTPAWRKQS